MGPSFLIASPQLSDPFFERTVVLLWHHDEDGARGVVVNRPMEHTLVEVLEFDGVDLSPYQENRLSWGGPVDEAGGTVLTPVAIDAEDGFTVPGLSISQHRSVLQDLVERAAPLKLCLGHAGWGPGQLDSEIATGGWLFTDLDPDLVFLTPPDELYDRALATLGLTAQTVWMRPVDE